MEKKIILVLGAGRSSSVLINYLLNCAQIENWHIVVGDYVEAAAKERIANSSYGTAISFNIENIEQSRKAIQEASIVISVLPASFHPKVAALCLEYKKHLLTASYVSPEMRGFHEEAVKKGILLLNECGLDPGIDHMSAMQVIDRIKEEGGTLVSFESFTGGLIAPQTAPENPWRYKFTWNPRNVVLAGQGTAKYLQNNQYKFIPYQQLFKRVTTISLPGLGDFEGYANRDSLSYINTYGLQNIQTMLRGTLRNKGFCSAWNIFVQLGCTDDTYMMDGVPKMTHRDFINAFLSYDEKLSVEEKISALFGLDKNSDEMKRISWSGLFDKELIGLEKGTPAQLLEHILNKKWKLKPEDKDLIVMWHKFVYELKGKRKEIHATLVALGDNAIQTAMAKTVGLPVAIAAKLLMQGKISARGVVIPISKEIYEPILAELGKQGIQLSEREVS